MTAFDDMLAKADEVLEKQRRMVWFGDDGSAVSLAEIMGHPPDHAPDLARALKAVAEALETAEHYCGDDVATIRAAIERRLKEPK